MGCLESCFQGLHGVLVGVLAACFSPYEKNHVVFSFLALTVFSFSGKKWGVVEESGSFLHRTNHAKPRLKTD
jgi:hypothetical protein